jgi:3-deoxy-manno-octulosonate cytidylyltransferase (CMP-KDO synthetase)
VRTVVVIPARFGSTRLPGKPLLNATGKYPVASFGGTAVLTRADHPSGPARVAEVAERLDADAVVNLQGDEPLFDPAAIDLLAELVADPATDVATLAAPIRDRDAYVSPNVVKVVCDDRGQALYFSRSPIPCYRDGTPPFDQPGADAPGSPVALQHLGVYAYRRDVLLKLAKAPPHPLEAAEKLEQLRVLGAGGTIRVGVVGRAHRGIDTPDDYAAFVEFCRSGESRRAA